MSAAYTLLADLLKAAPTPADGILSRPIHNDEQVKVVLFAFGAGQELSEHTSSMPATVHFLQGEATLTLGGDTVEATAGTWVHMPAGLRHSVRARTPVVMLLSVLKQPK